MFALVAVLGVVVFALFVGPERRDPRHERDEAMIRSVEQWRSFRRKMERR